jgi:hypothetical protein
MTIAEQYSCPVRNASFEEGSDDEVVQEAEALGITRSSPSGETMTEQSLVEAPLIHVACP